MRMCAFSRLDGANGALLNCLMMELQHQSKLNSQSLDQMQRATTTCTRIHERKSPNFAVRNNDATLLCARRYAQSRKPAFLSLRRVSFKNSSNDADLSIARKSAVAIAAEKFNSM